MAWVRIDDAFAQHPKLAKAGPLAIAMQIAGLCYCNRNLTDGFIPRGIARTLLDWQIVDASGAVCTLAYTNGVSCNAVTSEWVIAQLVDAGVWIEEPTGYQIYSYLEYQPSAQDVKRQREKTKSRVNQWRSKKHRPGNDVRNVESNGDSNGDSNDDGNAVTNGGVTRAPNPNPNPIKERVVGAQPSAAPLPLDLPSNQTPTEAVKSGPGNGAQTAKTRTARGKRLLDDVDALPDAWRDFCRAERPELRPDELWARFRDYWVARPGQKGVMLDWFATWRNWVRNEKPPPGSRTQRKRDYSLL